MTIAKTLWLPWAHAPIDGTQVRARCPIVPGADPPGVIVKCVGESWLQKRVSGKWAKKAQWFPLSFEPTEFMLA